MIMRPSTFHAPGLDCQTDRTIKQILDRWSKGEAPPKDKAAKGKKRK